MKTGIEGQSGTAKLNQAMLLSNNPSLFVTKGEWGTQTLLVHTAISEKVIRKRINVICLSHFPQSNKTVLELLL